MDIEGYTKIEVYVKDEDYKTLLAAQKAFRAEMDNPSCDPEIKAEGSRLLREVMHIAGPALCGAAEAHSKKEAS